LAEVSELVHSATELGWRREKVVIVEEAGQVRVLIKLLYDRPSEMPAVL
jgi:hypothetical protein